MASAITPGIARAPARTARDAQTRRRRSRPQRRSVRLGAEARTLPDFIVIGAQKAATTSLWSHLRSHPDVFMPDVKELNFFAQEGTWHRGADWYRSWFRARRSDQVAGEASPGYTMFPIFSGTPQRMASVVPDAKLIYVVREPIERMISSWIQSRSDGFEERSLGEALLFDIRYVSLSQYATQLERYLELFDRSQLLVVRAEDLGTRPSEVLEEVCTFVGVDVARGRADLDTRHNERASKPVPRHRTILAAQVLQRARCADLAYKLKSVERPWTHRRLRPDEVEVTDDLRERMTEYLQPEMVRLRAIVGPELDLWGYA